MLARLAENLFWTGRYIERAEDGARLVDVTYHSLLESPEEATQAWKQLLDVMHLDSAYADRHDDVVDVDVIRFLVLDRSHPGSLVSAVGRARENARSVRELVSTELWEAINGLELDLRARDLDAEVSQRPYDVLAMIKQRCQTVFGAMSETMPRDEGWRFLQLGRMLERAEMTCRLLSVRLQQLVSSDKPAAFHDWIAVLKSASALEAYRRAYRASMEPVHVVEFLLLSRDFPRSVLFSLLAAEQELIQLSDEDAPTSARRRIGRMRSELEYSSVEELLAGDLYAFLDHMQEEASGVAGAVGDAYFRHTHGAPLHWIAAT